MIIIKIYQFAKDKLLHTQNYVWNYFLDFAFWKVQQKLIEKPFKRLIMIKIGICKRSTLILCFS